MDTSSFKFDNPSFLRRLGGMLGVDFYRLFTTPLFYIFLAIAAVIPAMILGAGSSGGADGNAAPLFENTWHLVAAESPIYAISDIGEYANMNMVFIFGGIMVSIFIGHDYRSGYVKQLFTTHAKKIDYMLSKTITCAFAMTCMCVTYTLGAVGGGIFAQASFEADIPALIMAIVGKMMMSLGWASLYTFLNILFRKYFGISIASSFFFGTGILIIGAGAVIENVPMLTPVLNVFLYGSSVYACLASTPLTLVICFLCSLAWTAIYNIFGAFVLSRTDVY